MNRPSHEERLAAEAAEGGAATVYAELMNFALEEPRQSLYKLIERKTSSLTGDLAEELAEQLRRAYTAGVADGYRQAHIEEDSR